MSCVAFHAVIFRGLVLPPPHKCLLTQVPHSSKPITMNLLKPGRVTLTSGLVKDVSFEHPVPHVHLTSIKELVTANSDIFVNLLTSYSKSLKYLSSFAFNLVDLVNVEETEILPDMSVNFKDFGVETRFVVAICSGACTTLSTMATSWLALCRLTFRLIVFNGLINTADLPLIYIYSNLTPASLKTVPETLQSSRGTETSIVTSNFIWNH